MASSFRDEHFRVVAVGGGAAPEAAERLRREITEQVTVPEAAERMGSSMDELATAQELIEAEDAAQVARERQERFDATRAAQRAAYYAPQPEMPGTGMTQGFEREM